MTDIDNCKVPACVDHECRLLHIPQESCCIVDEDCEDGDACTEDICNPGNNLCSHLPKGKGCCNDEGDCLEDDDPCTRVSCIADECIYQSLQGCCMGDWQCDDGGACTLDLCVDYECRFLPGLKAGCCVEDGDCPWPKGPCQDAWCGPEGTCEEGPTPACELALDHAELFNDHLPLDALGWSVTGPAPAAWAAAFGGGPLGPDGRRVLTLAGGDGPLETCLVSPAFTGAAGGFASVTWEQWIEAPASNPEGLLRLEAWPAALAGETEVLWSAQPASGVVNRRDPWTAALPLKIAAGTFRLAFCADLPAVATPFQWSVDNVFVGAGRPPEIQGATEPVLLQPGQKATLPILVKDDDSPPPVQAYVTGPAHATLGSRKPGPGPELTLVKIDLRPVAEIDVGEWEVRVTVTDGFFYDRAWIEETVYVALCDTDAECDDLNDCSQDWCDPFLGCQHLFAPGCCNELTPCDDGSACTVDTCVEGTCAVAPLECNDSNLCTNDLCDPATGCLYPFNALACDDGSVCTVDDHCSLGTCTGDPLDCGDGLDCTLDTCDPVEGCHSTPICDDGIFCTTDACTPLGCYSGKSPAWTPVLDGLLDGDWPPWSVLATKSDPFKPIHLHAQVDAGHLYLALDMVPGEGEALLVFVDRDFGAGTGYASLAEIPSGGGMQPLDAALPVDLAVSLPGFGADLALGSVGGAQVVGMAPDAGARVLLPGGPEAVPATVLGEPALGEMEMALAWSVLLPGEDLSGEILALLVVLVDLDDLSTPWQLPYTPFGQLTAVSFVGVPGPACLLPVCGDAVMD
ncbi:MAG: hypothetical protein FJ098_12235, partial [Deltaproteobacteria bacterium]|nr:hypothetical protein [Deltaproteobacteria bacterium]